MTKIEGITRVVIHQIIDDNIVRAIGYFHSDNFDQDNFIYEINKKFKLTPKIVGVDGGDLLEKVIKLSILKSRGRFNSKELNQNKLSRELFKNFQLEIL